MAKVNNVSAEDFEQRFDAFQKWLEEVNKRTPRCIIEAKTPQERKILEARYAAADELAGQPFKTRPE